MSRAISIALLIACACTAQTTPTVGTWTSTSPGGNAGVTPLLYDNMQYISSIKMHCIWGDYKTASFSSEGNNATICYSYANNAWYLMQMGSLWAGSHIGQAGHANGQWRYMSDRDAVVGISGDGSGSLTAQSFLSHFWWWDVAGLSGQDHETTARAWMNGATTPNGSACYDSTNHKLVIYPAHNSSGTLSTGIYDPATGLITTPSTTGTAPIELGNVSFDFNPDDGKCYLFGGIGVGGNKNDIFSFDAATNVWSGTITTTCTGADCTSNKPPARQAAGMAYSPVDHVFLMAGGISGDFGSGTAYTDTWLFNPATSAWAQQSPGATYTNDTTSTVFERLTYDAESNVFVLSRKPRGIFVYPVSTALAFGRSSPSYSPTAGSLNVIGSQSWAKDPAIAVNGTTVYAGWIETGTASGGTACDMDHPYISSTPNNNTWTGLPTGTQAARCAAIDPESSSNQDASKVKLAVVDGTLWEVHEKFNSGVPSRAWAKSWTGSAWSGGEVGCITSACAAHYVQFPAAFIAVGTKPTLAAIEWDNDSGNAGYIYVQQYVGAAWGAVGAKLNINTTSDSRALSAALATDGTNPSVCWAEEVKQNRITLTTTPQIQCKSWNGSAWVRFGSASLNQSATSFANDPAMAYAGGSYYIAWTERTASGPNKLFVCQWTGSACTLLGGAAININATTGWAAHPSMATDGTSIWVAWEEQTAPGQHSLGHVAKWNGSAWSAVGGDIAADTTNGSIEGITLALVGTAPTVAFAEMKFGALRQTYAKQWNGTDWGDLGSAPDPPATSNTVMITNTGATTADYPIQIGRAFGLGEIPSGQLPQAYIGSTAVDTQVDVKARWGDSSLKHAVISFLVPSFTGGSTITVYFPVGTTVGNTALTKAQMLDAAYDFDAVISLTQSGVTKTASARTMLTADDYALWTSGPIATTILLGNHTQGTTCGGNAASTYDFGFDSYCPIRPLFEATFWATTNQVRVRYIGELTNSEQLEDVAINSVLLTSGSASPATRYTRSTVTMTAGSRWSKTYWIGGTPPAIDLNHNLAYLSGIKVLPKYDTTLTVSSGALTTSYANWTSWPRDLYQAGSWADGGTCCSMIAGGGHGFIGPAPHWTVRWMYTGDHRSHEETMGNLDLAGSYPIHYREGNTAKHIDRAGAVSGVGRIVAISERPEISWVHSNTPANDYIGGPGASASTMHAVGAIADIGMVSGWTLDAAHHPNFYAEYLLTGDHYALEENWFWTGWATWYAAWTGTTWRSRGPTGVEGAIPLHSSQGYQLRGQGWTFLARVRTAFISPDGSPEKTYFDALTTDAIANLEGQRNITTTTYNGNTMWNFGYVSAFTLADTTDRYWSSSYDSGTYLGLPTLRWWDLGSGAACDDRIINLAATDGCTVMWMQDYVTLSLGVGKDLGYPTDALLAWLAPNYIGQVTDPAYNPFIATAYRTPNLNATSTAWLADWAAVKATFLTDVQNETGFNPGTITAEDGSAATGNVQPLATAVSYVADQPGGGAAWAWAATNISTHLTDDGSYTSGYRWAILPRSTSSGSGAFIGGKVTIGGVVRD